MSNKIRKQVHIPDQTYGRWHRHFLGKLWAAIGHRLLFADRDWMEVCNFCREPIALFEEVLDLGQNLNEKNVRWTKKLATFAKIPAFLIAPRIKRSKEKWARIHALEKELLELYDEEDIEYFTAKSIFPDHDNRLIRYSQKDWAMFVASLHRMHHTECHHAQEAIKNGDELPVRIAKLLEFVHGDDILTKNDQPSLFFGDPEVTEKHHV